MKKYIISTLTAAAAMAVPAFSADGDLIASWNFTGQEIQDGKIYATGGDTSLYISTASKDTLSNGILYIEPAESDKTTIDVSSANVTLSEGISVVMTITGWSTNSGGGILASIETDNTTDGNYAAAIGESGTGTSRSGWFAADGSASYVTVTQDGSLTYTDNWTSPITVAMTFVGDCLCLYEIQGGEYVLVADATINSGNYENVVGTIKEVALGSWDSTLNGSAVNNLTISSLEIYRGDIMAAPEPSMFGLMFGLGAIGLVATRRRKRA